MILDCAGRQLDLTVPQVMGILNITPDSFSDGGDFLIVDKALEHASAMVDAGAAIIDIGGESTRPGAQAVSVAEELDRVLPILEALQKYLSIPLSIDTSKPEVMRAAIASGAGLINDVYALQLPGALESAAQLGVPVCLMHMQGEPRTMQEEPDYTDVTLEVRNFLQKRVVACKAAGIKGNQIIIDPGFGFGKSTKHNLVLLNELQQLVDTGLTVLVGLSRKSLIGQVLGKEIHDRTVASVSLGLMALERGARLLRVHDVEETVEAVRLFNAVTES